MSPTLLPRVRFKLQCEPEQSRCIARDSFALKSCSVLNSCGKNHDETTLSWLDEQHLHVKVTEDKLRMLHIGLQKACKGLEDWEIGIRTGFERHELEALLGDLQTGLGAIGSES